LDDYEYWLKKIERREVKRIVYNPENHGFFTEDKNRNTGFIGA